MDTINNSTDVSRAVTPPPVADPCRVCRVRGCKLDTQIFVCGICEQRINVRGVTIEATAGSTARGDMGVFETATATIDEHNVCQSLCCGRVVCAACARTMDDTWRETNMRRDVLDEDGNVTEDYVCNLCQTHGLMGLNQQLLNHLEHGAAACMNECGATVQADEMDRHEIDCPNVFISCQHCPFRKPRRVYNEEKHYDNCPQRPTPCPKCSLVVPFETLPHQCLRTMVAQFEAKIAGAVRNSSTTARTLREDAARLRISQRRVNKLLDSVDNANAAIGLLETNTARQIADLRATFGLVNDAVTRVERLVQANTATINALPTTPGADGLFDVMTRRVVVRVYSAVQANDDLADAQKIQVYMYPNSIRFATGSELHADARRVGELVHESLRIDRRVGEKEPTSVKGTLVLDDSLYGACSGLPIALLLAAAWVEELVGTMSIHVVAPIGPESEKLRASIIGIPDAFNLRIRSSCFVISASTAAECVLTSERPAELANYDVLRAISVVTTVCSSACSDPHIALRAPRPASPAAVFLFGSACIRRLLMTIRGSSSAEFIWIDFTTNDNDALAEFLRGRYAIFSGIHVKTNSPIAHFAAELVRIESDELSRFIRGRVFEHSAEVFDAGAPLRAVPLELRPPVADTPDVSRTADGHLRTVRPGAPRVPDYARHIPHASPEELVARARALRVRVDHLAGRNVAVFDAEDPADYAPAADPPLASPSPSYEPAATYTPEAAWLAWRGAMDRESQQQQQRAEEWRRQRAEEQPPQTEEQQRLHRLFQS